MQPSWLRGLKPHSRQAVCVLLAALSVACVDGGTASPTPPPPVSDTAESAYPLAATDETLRMECQHAAALLGFSVPCPTALPETNNPVRGEIPGAFRDARISPKEGCALGSGFLLEPTGIKDLDLFHLFVEGAQAERNRCGTAEPHEEVRIGDRLGSLMLCTDAGLHEGHTMVRFEVDDISVMVSAHGHDQVQRRAVLAIAEEIEMVPPG